MNNSPLLFIDSGIGGLPYLEWLKKRMPEESFVYIADNKNFPFGTKNRNELINIMVATIAEAEEQYSPKAAVLACNTASVVSLDVLRNNFNFPFIGVVPAIKPAAFTTKNKRIGLMASNRTIEDEYTERLIKDFASDCEVFKLAAGEIIDFIENRLYNSDQDEIRAVIAPAVKYFKDNEVDIVVLGCTHFLFLEKELQEELGGNVMIIDSRDGVGRQIMRVLEDKDLKSGRKTDDKFILTGNKESNEKIRNYTWISEKYGLCAV
ncbi:MAG: glutamate racemase [Spirochaetales bacterium]|uniref:Glutamate racemase n=1 Tax=Candidatus Thalassospirochaeta sargassi TaxID=3119039 RepID=A0AAJ1IFY1_9SPIO|nr:glutamate racemase [Spirochaetales bacterium]